MAKIDAFFNLMFEQKASDLHLSSGNPPMLRIHGELQRVDYPPLENDALKAMLYEIAPEYKIKHFEETGDVDFGYEIPNVSRFRANFFNQKNGIAAVFRQIPSKVFPLKISRRFDAPLPPVLKKFCHAAQGAGASSPARPAPANPPRWRRWSITRTRTGAITSSPSRTRSNSCTRARTAWSTTAKSAFTRKSFASALRGALREDPDIILVGEMRDLETIELAITAASTGHLVFGTLHTPSAAKTVDRIIDVFPADQQNKIRATLSEALKGVVAQNLFKRMDKKGRVRRAGNPGVHHGHREPGARRQDAPDSRHDPGRQEARQPAARRRDHGPSAR